MNKLITATALAFIFGSIGLVSAETVTVQSTQDENLTGVYATDFSGEFFGVAFQEQENNTFGTVDSIDQLQLNETQVCYHYVTEGSQGIFGNQEEIAHSQECMNYDQLDSQQQDELMNLSGDMAQDGITGDGTTEENTTDENTTTEDDLTT